MLSDLLCDLDEDESVFCSQGGNVIAVTSTITTTNSDPVDNEDDDLEPSSQKVSSTVVVPPIKYNQYTDEFFHENPHRNAIRSLLEQSHKNISQSIIDKTLNYCDSYILSGKSTTATTTTKKSKSSTNSNRPKKSLTFDKFLPLAAAFFKIAALEEGLEYSKDELQTIFENNVTETKIKNAMKNITSNGYTIKYNRESILETAVEHIFYNLGLPAIWLPAAQTFGYIIQKHFSKVADEFVTHSIACWITYYVIVFYELLSGGQSRRSTMKNIKSVFETSDLCSSGNLTKIDSRMAMYRSDFDTHCQLILDEMILKKYIDKGRPSNCFIEETFGNNIHNTKATITEDYLQTLRENQAHMMAMHQKFHRLQECFEILGTLEEYIQDQIVQAGDNDNNDEEEGVDNQLETFIKDQYGKFQAKFAGDIDTEDMDRILKRQDVYMKLSMKKTTVTKKEIQKILNSSLTQQQQPFQYQQQQQQQQVQTYLQFLQNILNKQPICNS